MEDQHVSLFLAPFSLQGVSEVDRLESQVLGLLDRLSRAFSRVDELVQKNKEGMAECLMQQCFCVERLTYLNEGIVGGYSSDRYEESGSLLRTLDAIPKRLETLVFERNTLDALIRLRSFLQRKHPI